MMILLLACTTMTCSEIRIPSDTGGVIGCMMRSQPQIVNWLVAHPGNRVDRWKCADLDPVVPR